MAELFVQFVLATSLCLYAITAGADFGAGVIELFTPKAKRRAVQTSVEKAIAPVWEANHVWIILALVIIFVGYPLLHTTITTYLHIPLILMLVGIVVRGAAFTLRYYGNSTKFSRGFHLASVAVPVCMGMIAGTLKSGTLPARPTDFLGTYVVPWISPFPLCVGLLTLVMFVWTAYVFMAQEEPSEHYQKGAARMLIVLVFLLVICAVLSDRAVDWRFALCGITLLAGLAESQLGLLSRRIGAGVAVTAIIIGYYTTGAPVYYSDGTTLTWVAASAPLASINALAVALVIGAVLIFPGMFWLLKIFKLVNQK